MATNNIVVVGAGVIGLTTAYLLSQDRNNAVTVAAKHMPGDYDVEYCSPWAGANYMPTGAKGSDQARWEKETWPALEKLAREVPEAGVHIQEAVILNRTKDRSSATGQWFAELLRPDPWYKDVVPDFRLTPQKDLPPGIDNASAWTSVCINTALYLPWLVSQCRANGVRFRRSVFAHITDASSAGIHHSGSAADVVVNCTGLASRTLGGVRDEKMYPARGQVVVVRNEAGGKMYSISGCDDGEDEVCYVMQRADGGGTVLGGCYQKGNWESGVDPNLAVRIMKRCVEICPDLVGVGEDGKRKGIEGLDVVRHGVGLRPVREGGTRVEMERIGGVRVVHNYGHGGFGYQASYGACADAVGLVREALREKARL